MGANYRRGLLRLWLVATLAWYVAVTVANIEPIMFWAGYHGALLSQSESISTALAEKQTHREIRESCYAARRSACPFGSTSEVVEWERSLASGNYQARCEQSQEFVDVLIRELDGRGVVAGKADVVSASRASKLKAGEACIGFYQMEIPSVSWPDVMGALLFPFLPALLYPLYLVGGWVFKGFKDASPVQVQASTLSSAIRSDAGTDCHLGLGGRNPEEPATAVLASSRSANSSNLRNSFFLTSVLRSIYLSFLMLVLAAFAAQLMEQAIGADADRLGRRFFWIGWGALMPVIWTRQLPFRRRARIWVSAVSIGLLGYVALASVSQLFIGPMVSSGDLIGAALVIGLTAATTDWVGGIASCVLVRRARRAANRPPAGAPLESACS